MLIRAFLVAGALAALGSALNTEGPTGRPFVLVDDIQVPVDDLHRHETPLGCLTFTGKEKMWPEGKLRYAIATDYTHEGYEAPYLSDNDERIAWAVSHIQAKTCIRFSKCASPYTCAQPFVLFISSSFFCSSPLGMQGGINQITATNCDQGGLVHEILHTLGIMHEQSRNDRDDYVFVNESNIIPWLVYNFAKSGASGRDMGAYDYGSIMHYRSDAAAVDPAYPSIAAPVPIGQQTGLSRGDIDTIDFLYNGCSEVYEAPICITSKSQAIVHTMLRKDEFVIEFDAECVRGGTMRVDYSINPWESESFTTSVAEGQDVSDSAKVMLVFHPPPTHIHTEYTLSATFTANTPSAPSTACSVRVKVESDQYTASSGCQEMWKRDLEYLDRHRIDCPSLWPTAALLGFRLEHGTCVSPNMRFVTQCRQPPSTSCSTRYTACQLGLGQNPSFLDRHNVACQPSEVMRHWKADRDGCSDGDIRIEYSCCQVIWPLAETYNGESTCELGAIEQMEYLDRIAVTCPAEHYLRTWKLQVGCAGSNTHMKYVYTCGKFREPTPAPTPVPTPAPPTPVPTPAPTPAPAGTTTYWAPTGCQATMGRTLGDLTLHTVECPSLYVQGLSGFRLETGDCTESDMTFSMTCTNLYPLKDCHTTRTRCHVGANSENILLSEHYPQCGVSGVPQVMWRWKVFTGGICSSTDSMQLEYVCCDFVEPGDWVTIKHISSCGVGASESDVKYLGGMDVQCEPNFYLQSWRLTQEGCPDSQMRYMYECVGNSVPTPASTPSDE